MRQIEFTGTALLLAGVLTMTGCSGIDPVAYEPPEDPGFVAGSPFAANAALQSATALSIAPALGPEDIAVGPDGLVRAGISIYTSPEEVERLVAGVAGVAG